MNLSSRLKSRQSGVPGGDSSAQRTEQLFSIFTQLYNENVVVSPQLSKTVVSVENFSSLSDSQCSDIQSAIERFGSAFDAISVEKNITGKEGYRHFDGDQFQIGNQVKDVSMESARYANFLAGDIKGSFITPLNPIMSIANGGIAQIKDASGMTFVRSLDISQEAYNEADIRNSSIFTMTYNYQSVRQDEFGETLFPTIVQSSDQAGITINVKLMTVFNGVERNISGAFQSFNRKNIIRAVADSTVLYKDTNKVVPVVRTESTAKFVAAGDVAVAAVVIDDESINTAPIKIGTEVDILALSQPASMLAKGTNDQTDSLEPAVTLSNIYLKFTNGTTLTDVIKLSTLNIPYSNFVFNPQDNYKQALLNFTTDSVVISKNQKRIDGTALTYIDAIDTNDWAVRLKLNLTGSVNVETGKLIVNGATVEVFKVMKNSDGTEVSIASGAGQTFAGLIAAGAVLGYDVLAYRTNANRRQRGQLINVTEYNQIYNVPLRAPITAQHPINANQQVDSSDVQTLINTTRTRTSNDAVKALIEFGDTLKGWKNVRDSANAGPDTLGVGRFYVIPQYKEEAMVIPDVMNSITSANRTLDLQAAIVNRIRYMAISMYMASEYKAASDALSGGMGAIPTVVVATDPSIASFIMAPGDLRTLGGEFNLRVVSTLDLRLRGKIYVTFGVFDESRNQQPNPLNFGNMLWYPETVVTANITRNGAISRETVVQPRYLFINNLPILGVITVTGLDAALSKAAIDFLNVTPP